jgi:hypothetical protein
MLNRAGASRPWRDNERLPATLAGLHFAACVCLLLPKLFSLIGGSQHRLMSPADDANSGK